MESVSANHVACSSIGAGGLLPSNLVRAAETVDQLLADVGQPVAVMVIESDTAPEQLFTDPARSHILTSGGDVVVLAFAPTWSPAEGEQAARTLCQRKLARSVAVATSTAGDTGETLVAAAVATFVQAAELSLDDVTVCPDDDRSWTISQNGEPDRPAPKDCGDTNR